MLFVEIYLLLHTAYSGCNAALVHIGRCTNPIKKTHYSGQNKALEIALK